VVRVMSSESRNSLNSPERNSPALSMWSCPTMRTGSGLPMLEIAFSLATKDRTRCSASDFDFRKYRRPA